MDAHEPRWPIAFRVAYNAGALPDRSFIRPTVPHGDLELRISDGGSRWKLQATAAVEVWRGALFVGTMSGSALCLLVEYHLANAALQAAIQAELATPTPVTIIPAAAQPAPRTPPPLPVRPVVPVFSREQKAALRKLRRTPKNKGGR